MRLTRREFLRVTGLAGVASVIACAPQARPTPTGPAPPATSAGPSPSASLGGSGPPPSTSAPIPLRRRIAGLLVVGFRGERVDPEGPIARAIADDGLGGVILFDRDQLTGGARNVRSPAQVRDLVAGLQDLAVDRTLLVAVDQEGGRVTRLGPEHGFPPVASEARIGSGGDADAVAAWADGIAATLESVGVNLNLAPVVDLDVNPRNPAIGALGRAFSARPEVVAQFAGLEVRAHRAHGVLTAPKHFPGLGSASTNTDFGVADVTRTWSDGELEPYRALIAAGEVDVIMVGHVVNGGIDRDVPASLSAATVDGLLRGRLGWAGPVITDDLQAAAITHAFGADDAIGLAIEAGVDLLLFANQQVYDPGIVGHAIDVIEGLVRSGRIAEERIDASFARITALAESAFLRTQRLSLTGS
ncbi:MAG TPA: glycoside hydrolase family 3 N-terminal domain-containing protein [Candidatus Limnocylindrales bacterium]